MPKPDDLRRLNRHVLLATLASLGVLLVGLSALVLYFEPSLAGASSETRGGYLGEVPWLVTGALLASAGIAFLYILDSWPSQLKKTVLHTPPVRMTVKLEVEQDSDSTAYYAVINQSTEAGKILAWRAHIWIYPPQIGEDLGHQVECDVFFSAETGLPVAIEHSRGMLWVMAGNGAVKGLPTE